MEVPRGKAKASQREPDLETIDWLLASALLSLKP